MRFKEILEGIGLTAEQVAAVESGMQEAGIYLASEEGLDQKYADAKKELEKYDGAVIDDGTKDTRIAELEQENGRLKYQSAVDKVMAAYHVKNPEYISYLIGQKNAALKEDGTIDGIDEIMEGLKKDQPEFFEAPAREKRRVEVKEWKESHKAGSETADTLKGAIAEKMGMGGTEE